MSHAELNSKRSRRAGALLGTWAAASLALLTGCASPPQPLYQWGSYQSLVYAHFKGDGDPAEQYQEMQEHAREVSRKGRALPPGFQAHMGLLEIQLGKLDNAVLHLEAEKAQFPESAAYVNWLLKHINEPKIQEPKT